MSLIYATSTILLVLKIFPFEPGLLPGPLSHKSCYGHYADVRENVSGYRLGLTGNNWMIKPTIGCYGCTLINLILKTTVLIFDTTHKKI